MTRQKKPATLDRLFKNMVEHLSRHPNDKATIDHMQKLGIYDPAAVNMAIKHAKADSEATS